MSDCPVVYVVLLSGREIIAELASDDGVAMDLLEPLAIESSADDVDPTRRLVYMSRFSPYSDGPRVIVKHAAVAYMANASALVTSYYRASLKYCEKFADERFVEGIHDTVEHIEKSLSKQDREDKTPIPPETFEALWRHLVTANSSNTCH